MKKQLFNLGFILTLSVFVACDNGDSDSIPATEDGQTNTASNPYIVNQGQSTEGNNINKNATGIKELDSRFEVPYVTGGADHYLLIRTVEKYGVNYIIEWDNQKRSQRWTAYQMYKGNSAKTWNRNSWATSGNYWANYNHNVLHYSSWDPFQPDPDLPEGVRTELSDYTNARGYSRGHIVPSADRLNSQAANEQTFYLSNIMPQSSRLNTGTWENMEEQVRAWNSDTYRRTLYIVKGGTIGQNQTNGKTESGLPIPSYFYMAIVSEKDNQYKGIAFIVEHANPEKNGTSPKNYVFTIDQLEELTGIDFFCNLPDNVENEMEKTVDDSFWKFIQ